MRAATFVVVIAIHGLFFYLFAGLRSISREVGPSGAPTILVFLPRPESTQPAQPVPKPPVRTHAGRPAAPKAPAAVILQPKPESSSLTPMPAPDWRAQAQIAANDQIKAELRKRDQPSPLAPHDFSGARPGSTDDSRPKFGWYRAGTNRVEGTPGGGLLVNINDHCAVAILFIFPFPMCKVGKIPARGDLFDHMNEAPPAAESKVP